MRVIWAMICLFMTLRAFAGDESVGRPIAMPIITSHSEQTFSVYRGDKVQVAVEASGDKLEATWVTRKGILCKTLTCEIDTTAWAIGSEVVTFVLYNPGGSLTLRYKIKIMAPAIGRQPKTVWPPLVIGDGDVEKVHGDEWSVRILRGLGFSYHQNKIQVIGALPRVLDKHEKLRTRRRSMMRFGLEGGFAHILPAASSVTLVPGISDRLAILLNSGSIRSRVLDANQPRWSVLVRNWLQVDLDEQGDVLVSRLPASKAKRGDRQEADSEKTMTEGSVSIDAEDKKERKNATERRHEQVSITVLRGTARVFVYSEAGDASEDSGTAVILPQGVELLLERGRPVGRPQIPDASRVGPLVLETTPHLFQGDDPSGAVGQWVLARDAAKEASLEAAREANDRRDYVAALEILGGDAREKKPGPIDPILEAEQDYERKRQRRNDATRPLRLFEKGRAYLGLLQLTEALALFVDAADSAPEVPDFRFYAGVAAMRLGNWAEADDHFAAALTLGFDDLQLAEYYRGVVQLQTENHREAMRSFTRASWRDGGADVARSIMRFLLAAENHMRFLLSFYADIWLDSNVLRSTLIPEAAAEAGINTMRSLGSTMGAGLSVWPMRGARSDLAVAIAGEKRAHFSGSLKPLDQTQQELTFKPSFWLGNDLSGNSYFRLRGDLGAATIGIGSNRALDQIKGSMELGSPLLWDVHIGTKAARGLDPLPEQNDVLDPVRWEVVPAGDRSCRMLYDVAGVSPRFSEFSRLELEAERGRVTYTNEFHADEDFTDVNLRLALRLAVGRRQLWSLTASQLKRGFPERSDRRQDQKVTEAIDWRWFFHPIFYQHLGATLESQKSNAEGYTYRRTVFAYGLGLSL